MAHISRFTVLLAIWALLLTGCNDANKKKSEEVGVVDTEQRKAELLQQIDAKYENPRAHYELGRIFHTDGLWSKAENEYRVAVAFDPILWDAEAALVKLFQDKGDLAKANSSGQNAMERASYSAAASLGLAKAFQKEYLDEYALKCHSQALTLAPDSAEVYKHIGYYYLSKRDLGRAEANLRRSFELDPYQAEVAGELGRLGIIVEVPGIEIAPKVEQAPVPESI
jgi:tetratricopeptide (TPR) repeat protein